jgi:hypothetical protein
MVCKPQKLPSAHLRCCMSLFPAFRFMSLTDILSARPPVRQTTALTVTPTVGRTYALGFRL